MTASPLQPALPEAPGYGRDTIADVLTSSAAALGASGFSNVLQIPSAKRICVVLVDGLGKSLLKQRAAHAPFLRSVLNAAANGGPDHAHQQTLTAAFPSTTVTSLTSLGTGVVPGQHGMVGYDVLDPGQDKVVNLLGNWDPGVDPETWQPFPTVFERLHGNVADSHHQPSEVRRLTDDPGRAARRHLRRAPAPPTPAPRRPRS